MSLIFDCDGVIVDSEIVAVRVVLRHLAPYGLQLTEATYSQKYSGLQEHEILTEIQAEYDLVLPEAFLADVGGYIAKAMREELQPIVGMPELLREIGPPLAVASNSGLPHVDRALRLAGVRELFGERVYYADQVARPKPHPDVYLHALQQLAFEPAQTVVVEDSRAGVQAAKAAGTTVIGFLGASHIHTGHGEALQQLGADYLAQDAAELRRLLQQLAVLQG